jgi:hypothetical protein
VCGFARHLAHREPRVFCYDLMGEQTAGRITLRVYPGAHHGFDRFTPPSPSYGPTVSRHPETPVQTEAEVKHFLA